MLHEGVLAVCNGVIRFSTPITMEFHFGFIGHSIFLSRKSNTAKLNKTHWPRLIVLIVYVLHKE